MLFYFQFFYSFPFNVISVATVSCFCGFHPPVVSTFSSFPPFCGFHPVWLLCGLHPPVVCIFPWLLCGVPFMVCTFMVYTLLWFPPSRGLHLCVVPTLSVVICGDVSWFAPSHGLHSAVVSTLPWFASSHGSHPPCGYSVVSLSWFALSWFTLCCGFHPLLVCIFAWFPPSLWLFVVSLSWFAPSRGLHSAVVSTLPWFASSHGSHPLVVTPWCPSWILA